MVEVSHLVSFTQQGVTFGLGTVEGVGVSISKLSSISGGNATIRFLVASGGSPLEGYLLHPLVQQLQVPPLPQ